MKIELKNIHHSERLSEETNAFSAILYIDGKKAGTASNNGHGGSTSYQANDPAGKKLIESAEIYCRSLPPEIFSSGGKNYELDMNLESYIDNLLNNHLQEKDLKRFQKRLEKEMERGIIVGIPDTSFSLWRFKMPIANYINNPKGIEVIKSALINNIVPTLKGGNVVMNTNIPENLLKDAGLAENQYVKRSLKENINKNDKKAVKGRRI